MNMTIDSCLLIFTFLGKPKKKTRNERKKEKKAKDKERKREEAHSGGTQPAAEIQPTTSSSASVTRTNHG